MYVRVLHVFLCSRLSSCGADCTLPERAHFFVILYFWFIASILLWPQNTKHTSRFFKQQNRTQQAVMSYRDLNGLETRIHRSFWGVETRTGTNPRVDEHQTAGNPGNRRFSSAEYCGYNRWVPRSPRGYGHPWLYFNPNIKSVRSGRLLVSRKRPLPDSHQTGFLKW